MKLRLSTRFSKNKTTTENDQTHAERFQHLSREERIIEAIEEIKTLGMPIERAARRWSIDPSTLRRRHQNNNDKHKGRSLLLESETKNLVNLIKQRQLEAHPMTKKEILQEV